MESSASSPALWCLWCASIPGRKMLIRISVELRRKRNNLELDMTVVDPPLYYVIILCFSYWRIGLSITGQRRLPFRCSWDLSLCYQKDLRTSQYEAKLGYTEHVHQEKSTLRCLSSSFVCNFGGLKSEMCQYNILPNKKEITHWWHSKIIDEGPL